MKQYVALVEWYWRGIPKDQEKPCLSATSSTTNLPWSDLKPKPDLTSENRELITWAVGRSWKTEISLHYR